MGVIHNRCHCIKGGHPISMHAFCEIVYTIKTYSVTSYCFKVFFLDDVALVCKCLNMFKACFTYNLVESEHTVRDLDFIINMSTA